MARKRLTSATLGQVNDLSAAREHVRLAENILGRSATDNEVLATADILSSVPPERAREINRRKADISRQTQRIAASPDGSEDPWDESGPPQPDPTNNQAYTKQVMTTPDHAVQDSLQKRDVHAPTASRASQISRATRQRYRLAGGEGGGEEDDSNDPSRDVPREEMGPNDRLDEMQDNIVDVDDVLQELEGEVGDLPGEEEDHDRESELGDDVVDNEFDDMTDDDLGDGGPGLDLDNDGDELDDLLNMEGEGDDFEDDFGGDEPDIFDGADDDMDDGLGPPEDEMDEFGGEGDLDDMIGPEDRTVPVPAVSRRQPTSSRQPRGRSPQQAGRRQAGKRVAAASGQGQARLSIDEILNLHDDDIERWASTPLMGDDLEALLGARVDRAGHRVASSTQPDYNSPAARQYQAMLGKVWNTEYDPEIIEARRQRGEPIARPGQGRRRVASQQRPDQQQVPRQVQATRRPSRRPQMQPPPDRRRGNVSARNNPREFDQVFGMDGLPDVSRFFDQ